MKKEKGWDEFEPTAKFTTKTNYAGVKAKKDFVICQNDYYKEIKAGDDISDVPEVYHENLKTEQVI